MTRRQREIIHNIRQLREYHGVMMRNRVTGEQFYHADKISTRANYDACLAEAESAYEKIIPDNWETWAVKKEGQ